MKQIFWYIKATNSNDIQYWYPLPHSDLASKPFAEVKESNYDNTSMDEVDDSHVMHRAVDTDWVGDISHCKSVSGIALCLAGGTILYKTKCLTESEFTVACDTTKAISRQNKHTSRLCYTTLH